jgi:hypothetical protein
MIGNHLIPVNTNRYRITLTGMGERQTTGTEKHLPVKINRYRKALVSIKINRYEDDLIESDIGNH